MKKPTNKFQEQAKNLKIEWLEYGNKLWIWAYGLVLGLPVSSLISMIFGFFVFFILSYTASYCLVIMATEQFPKKFPDANRRVWKSWDCIEGLRRPPKEIRHRYKTYYGKYNIYCNLKFKYKVAASIISFALATALTAIAMKLSP